MAIPGNLMTTAMAVMPHRNVERALEIALSVDIPYWPQLPLLSFREDMYVQASEHFPGIMVDMDKRTIRFSTDKFVEELEETLAGFQDPSFFDVSENYSAVYGRFLDLDLSERPAIRGQLEGPVSFGLNVLDQDKRPILFNDTVRPFMYEFLAKRINSQLACLKTHNANAFMFVDEPGLQFLFSGMAGYTDRAAKTDLDLFFAMIDRPRGIHLCGNPDWDFLLSLDLDVLSLDAFSNGKIFVSYASQIEKFLERGGILVWGLVPTNFEPYGQQSEQTLECMFAKAVSDLEEKGIDRNLLLARSLLSPATCCLVNPDREKTVEAAFGMVQKLSQKLRGKYRLA